ncbi:MAG: type II toxin-antitoxin system VapC family toxin [Synergistaceae bacterium]|nr:type II toxin-antitoxin system VapC family toxin [Synergistaceae bacterium]
MNKYLLDTHILLWAIEDPEGKLSAEVRDMIFDPKNPVYFSVVSLWEVAIKHMKSPDKLSISPQRLLAFCEEAGFRHLLLRIKHVMALETLRIADNAPPHHDPFDRILIAQAKAENMTFLTHDDKLALYDEPCVNVV